MARTRILETAWVIKNRHGAFARYLLARHFGTIVSQALCCVEQSKTSLDCRNGRIEYNPCVFAALGIAIWQDVSHAKRPENCGGDARVQRRAHVAPDLRRSHGTRYC